MRKWKRCLAGLLSVLCVLPLCANAEYLGAVPDDSVYMVETQRRTCTLIAAAMMVREFAQQHGYELEELAESDFRREAWFDGLTWDFTINTINVQCVEGIREAEDKTEYLKCVLKYHPEGVVIYDANQPHAIWLNGYDETTGVFYCADTISSRGMKTIPLVDSILRGDTQQAILDSLDRIWYVTGYRGIEPFAG